MIRNEISNFAATNVYKFLETIRVFTRLMLIDGMT